MWVVQYINLHVITQNVISANIYSGSLIGGIFEHGVVNGNDTNNVFFVTYETSFWRASVTLNLQKSI